MAEGAARRGVLRAVALDLDGTLYRQAPLRRAVLVDLARAHLLHPVLAVRTARALAAYRRAQERLRGAPRVADLAAAQLRLACEASDLDERFVAGCVARWMERAPLPHLRRCLRPGVPEFLEECRRRGLRLGVLSDYPAEAKLAALGLAGRFDAVLTAQAPEVGTFKPDPRGLLVLLAQLGVAADEALYVGDRAEVDGAAAAAAGVPCAILAGAGAGGGAGTWTAVSGFDALRQRVSETAEHRARARIAGGR